MSIIALAGHDDVKRDLVKSGIVPIIISLLTRHSNNASAAQYGLKCIAALTLREPQHSEQFLDGGVAEGIVECLKIHPDNASVQHSEQFLDGGVAEGIVECLKIHPDNASVQKNACWAIRNMVARCRTHNHQFKSLGIEPLLNQAYDKFGKEFGFDIKSALRDLECDVKLDEQWTGKGVQLAQ
ncbi:hypothetical protein NE865_15019 [Phthorimaea operculella]|nr:hypothetical protein NE865_15019 [Phthorimaea operculella]